MTELRGPAPKPCESCPYRRDVPSGVWAENEYRSLERYDEEMWAQPPALFQCHQNDQASGAARMCAGWVATHGDQLLGLRVAVAKGRVDPAVLSYTTDVPVFASGTEASEHGRAEIDEPSYEARVLVEKIAGRRPDVRWK